MGAELYRALMMYYICGSCYFTMIALMDYGIVRSSSRIHFILVAGLSFMILDTNWYSRRSWSSAVLELSSTPVGATVGATVGTAVENSFISSERPYSSALGMLRLSDRLNSSGIASSSSVSRSSSIAGGLSHKRAHPRDRLLLDRPEDMINDTFLHGAFQEHVEKSLCYENYKFLAEAMAYSNTTYRSPKQQVSRCYYTYTYNKKAKHMHVVHSACLSSS
jgi:hypothetical protein